jgi:DNA-binding NarL/FixJ family response regulator
VSPSPTSPECLRADVPRIVVAFLHPTMRRYICDLIEQGCQCWLATASPEPSALHEVVTSLHPDAIVIEASTFPQCCPDIVDTVPVEHVVVVGPYPDDAKRDAALQAGAGAWIPRDRLATELVHELRRITGQRGCPCGCQDQSSGSGVIGS